MCDYQARGGYIGRLKPFHHGGEKERELEYDPALTI